jgi:hypothetical protein
MKNILCEAEISSPAAILTKLLWQENAYTGSGMDIGAISGGNASTVAQVKLLKGQEKQEEKVAAKLLESFSRPAPEITGKGAKLDVVA